MIDWMRGLAAIAGLFLIAALPAAAEKTRPIDGIDPALLAEALEARDRHSGHVREARFITIIDYRKPSGEARFHLVDLHARNAEHLPVAHGMGSDVDHDGLAERFSNTPGSKMSSLGAFVTGATYHGRHGLSLRLHGLEPRNDQAEARAIVIHGADYVEPGRARLGRSWGCPALSQQAAARIIPILAGGSFVYVMGP